MAMRLLVLVFAVLVAAEDVEQIACGSQHTCVRGSQGSVMCWGNNVQGRLGIGTTDTMGDGDNEMGINLPVVDLGTGRGAIEVALGRQHTCARLDDGSLRCWGYNLGGQLGQGSSTHMGDEADEMGDRLPAVVLATGRTAVQIAAGTGSYHTCARLDDGTLQCWGDNGSGQLGLGHRNDMGDNTNEMGDHLPTVNLGTGRTAVEVCTGRAHTCARLDTGGIKCWGWGSSGKLGSGSSNDVGDGANEMGDNLEVVELGAGRTALQVVAGDEHTCARLDDGSVKCWGYGGYGQLGQGAANTIGDSANEMGDNLPKVSLGTGRTAKSLAAGGHNTCAILNNGALKCWGQNDLAQLGLGHTNHMGDNADEMGDYLPPVDLGTNRTAVEVAVSGGYHICARLDDGTVKCWGLQNFLGLGVSGGNLGDEPGEMGDSLPPVDISFPTTTTTTSSTTTTTSTSTSTSSSTTTSTSTSSSTTTSTSTSSSTTTSTSTSSSTTTSTSLTVSTSTTITITATTTCTATSSSTSSSATTTTSVTTTSSSGTVTATTTSTSTGTSSATFTSSTSSTKSISSTSTSSITMTSATTSSLTRTSLTQTTSALA